MTVLELISKAAGFSGPALLEFLRRVAAELPDLAPFATELITKLETALGSANLVELGNLSIKELGDIAALRLDGRSHPSDII